MSTTYKVKTGDTFNKISKVNFGSENNAQLIASANPGFSEPLTAGTSLTIPKQPNLSTSIDFETPNEVTLMINGVRFRYWETVRIKRTLTSIDTITFVAPFDENDTVTRATFKPFTYQDLQVFVGGTPLFTGNIIQCTPTATQDKKFITADGYAKAGVLSDCMPSPASYPLEYNNLTLQQIAQKICLPFGITAMFKADTGAPFKRVACSTSKKVIDFLIELAKQRNLIIKNNVFGQLEFLRSDSFGLPVAILEQGISPLTSISPNFSAQNYYSSVTGIQPTSTKKAGGKYTVQNPLLNGIVRPYTFTVNDSQAGDLKQAVEAKAGTMFGAMASYTVMVASWTTSTGKLWDVGDVVSLYAPSVCVYNTYNFIISEIVFTKNSEKEEAKLTLVMIGSYSGEIPKGLPWDL